MGLEATRIPQDVQGSPVARLWSEAPRMKYRPRHVIEYGAMRALTGLLNLLPYRASLAMALGLAAASYPAMRRRMAEARRRIRETLGADLPPGEAGRVARRAWRNFFFTSVETMRSRRWTKDWVSSATNFEAASAELRDHVRAGKGAIVASPHLGSWDLAGAAGRICGLPLFSIAGRQRNPLFNDYLNRLRELGGVKILIRGSSTLKAVLQELKSGKVLAILPDVRMPTPGLPIRFFGKTANIGPGMASFACHARVPIFPAIARREGWSRHHFCFGPPLYPDATAHRKLEILRLTQRVFDIMESAIRESPDQWFWFNKRWILEPFPAELPTAPEIAASDGAMSL